MCDLLNKCCYTDSVELIPLIVDNPQKKKKKKKKIKNRGLFGNLQIFWFSLFFLNFIVIYSPLAPYTVNNLTMIWKCDRKSLLTVWYIGLYTIYNQNQKRKFLFVTIIWIYIN